MAGFVSPLEDLAGWTLSVLPQATVPQGLRYGGRVCRALRAERATPEDVLMPAPGVLSRTVEPSGDVAVEVQVAPFMLRDTLAAIPFGVPTFYFVFAPGTAFSFDASDFDDEGAVLASVDSVTIIVMGQDRITRDPSEWARSIATAIPVADSDPWQSFADAVATALANDPVPAVPILDHCGGLVSSARLAVVTGPPGNERRDEVSMLPADAGDLQSTMRRLGLAENLLAGADGFRLEGVGGDVQFARVEDGLAGATGIAVTPEARHIQLTDVHGWLAEQFAIPRAQSAPVLARFTRGNLLTPYVNGKRFFHDFFELLGAVDDNEQGLHLTGGFSLEPEAELVEREKGTDAARTVLDVVKELDAAIPDSGGARFLSAKFIQFEPTQSLSKAEIAAFYFIVGVLGVANLGKLGLKALETDGSGFAILTLIALANQLYVDNFFDQNGEPLEFMREAVELLNDPDLKSFNTFSPHPATVDDNPLSPSGFPFDSIFPSIRQFGLYHQKIAVIKNSSGFFGFCGGIDMNPNRVDDEHHITSGPYHDVHAMVQGKAVHDVAQTFQERWERDGRDADGNPIDAAFAVPQPVDLADAGTDIVQVARTYPKTGGRLLDFAPDGDKTIRDTTIQAIARAKEYIHLEDQYFTPPPDYLAALVERVADGGLKNLIITLPAANDQPFGETPRNSAIDALRNAEAAAGAAPGEIVRIGVLRRHFTVPENTLRAASGKCILGEELSALPQIPGFDETVVLGPKIRVPVPPFWLAVDGELMWVYDEAPSALHTAPPPGQGRYLVDRALRTRLFGKDTGARPRVHEVGAAATVVDLRGIFVHAKLILIDDVFAGIGSANINRRGFYSDGEGHFFWLPEGLKTGGDNPIARLRQRLWAEFLNLPYPMAEPLLVDATAAARLFARAPIHGNRFVPLDAIPLNLQLGAFSGGDTLIASVLKLLFSTLVNIDHAAIFEGVVDPTTELESFP